jgi:hypothetical protein
MREAAFWIHGRAENGREAQRSIDRDTLRATADALALAMHIACQEIADELQPTFIDWTSVAA